MPIVSNHLESLLNEIPSFDQLIEKIDEGRNPIALKTLNGSSTSLFAEYLERNLKRPVFLLSADKEELEDIKFDFNNFFAKKSFVDFIKPQKKVKSNLDGEDDNFSWLINSLNTITSKESFIAIAEPDVLELKMPKSSNIQEHRKTLHKGEHIDFEQFKKDLALSGFDRVKYVAKQGEFSVRGGIIDLFPVSFQNPIRLEFWGDELDSIREFNPLSQRSISDFNKISYISKIFHSQNTEASATIFDYLPEETIVLVKDPQLLEKEYEDIPIPEKFQKITINDFGKADLNIKTDEQRNFNSSVKLFSKHLQELTITGESIIICADGEIHLNRIKDLIQDALILDDENLIATPDQTINNILWMDRTVSQGFSIKETKVNVFTEHELFNRHRNVTSSASDSTKYSLEEIKQLKIGDLVVHDDKGIGRFEGFKTVEISGSKQDCIQLAFQGDDRLYVNLNYIQKIQKYSAQEGNAPKLSKLGSTEWARKKGRIKKKLKDISRELIKLYAKRKMQKGYSFEADNVWQKEFEAAFMYEDTPDQLQATKDIKEDMESEQPMDRLVCGDVGFGKTEVAIRAAFKAVQSGKQVAVLVPTTVLAQQHLMTFKDRFNKYPINIDVLSRFRTKKEQTQILNNLKEGKVDIIIGTHRILSKDIEFKDLGLLVVDEEQRFGVKAKEKLREMRETIDTITLTATPIPRTLNFSLMGARDLSIIETPPRNRLPIQTEILESSDEKLIEIIDSEIKRGGQVFFVNDTVQDLNKLYTDLKMQIPQIKFAIAHGQMKSTQLEKVMRDFISGKFDVLLTTKIVESGLDIPNANTMIINNAQNFGLAELYQLRGRVGRANKQAYCYLLIPETKKITETAVKRLQAIEEFTELGSGLRLSLRDLEIRGAGNLLGAEQSGAIYDIGFELYQKILEEAVKELKLEEFSHVFEDKEEGVKDIFRNDEISIDLDVDAFIPESYIESDTERFSYYKKMFSINDNSELLDLKNEIKDKYGKIPEEAENLLFAVKVRSAAAQTGLEKILVKNNLITLVFPDESNQKYYEEAFPAVLDYLQTLESARLKQGKKKLTCDINIDNRSEAAEIIWKLKKAMEFINVE